MAMFFTDSVFCISPEPADLAHACRSRLLSLLAIRIMLFLVPPFARYGCDPAVSYRSLICTEPLDDIRH